MKALLATGISLCLTGIVIGNAYYQKKQFYSLVVYLTNSNPSMAVLYIQAFILVMLIGKLMKKIFFGQLRAAEFEHLVERSWYAVSETCLAFTVFRDDFNPKFIALFTVLLFLKAFHWLAEDRVDYMERSPVIGGLFHARILSLLVILVHLDSYFVMHAYQVTMTKGPSVQLVFGFEYAILIIMIVNISIKYILHAIDAYWEAPWEGKVAVLLYTELAVSFLKVLLYFGFVAIMVRTYTLPLFAFRPMYYTLRSFKNAFNNVVLSRRAIRNMNTLYEDVTPEELANADNVCIICREEMVSGAKKLPCNHIFHASCLRSWFQRQQTCPTCRLNVLRVNNAVPNHAQAAAAAAQPGVVPNQNDPLRGMMPNLQNLPPMPPPLPHFMPPPFFGLNLPPRMPENLSPLSEEELHRLEGQQRKQIEARIKLLKEIGTLLDASKVLMQQYCMVAQIPTTDIGIQTNESDFPSKVEVRVAPPSDFVATAGSSNGDGSSSSTSNDPNISSIPSGSSSFDESNATSDEIRRRRLQRFTQET